MGFAAAALLVYGVSFSVAVMMVVLYVVKVLPSLAAGSAHPGPEARRRSQMRRLCTGFE